MALTKTDSIPEGTEPYVGRITLRTMTTAHDRLAAHLATDEHDEPSAASLINPLQTAHPSHTTSTPIIAIPTTASTGDANRMRCGDEQEVELV
jgi:hypothetical protein